MNKSYKAIEYKVKIHHEEIINEDEPWLSVSAHDTYESRYCIIDSNTEEILDDAQGYGYKTAQKAYAAFSYKNRDKRKDKEKIAKKRHIQKWMKEHKEFVEAMDDIAFKMAKESYKKDNQLNATIIEKMFVEFDVKPDFTANELLKVWNKIN